MQGYNRNARLPGAKLSRPTGYDGRSPTSHEDSILCADDLNKQMPRQYSNVTSAIPQVDLLGQPIQRYPAGYGNRLQPLSNSRSVFSDSSSLANFVDRTICFTKTEPTLRFNFVGGKGHGILVSYVQPNSPAAQHGLGKGQKIHSINEYNFRNKTAEEAYEIISKRFPIGCKLTIKTRAKDKYLKSIENRVRDNFYIRSNLDLGIVQHPCLQNRENGVEYQFRVMKGDSFRVISTNYKVGDYSFLGFWLAETLPGQYPVLKRFIIPSESHAELELAKRRQKRLPNRDMKNK